MSDLFPNISLPKSNCKLFDKAVLHACNVHNVQSTEYFLEKVRQIYEMILVRHGLMIIGQPFGGKTAAYRVLSTALNEMNEIEGNVEYTGNISI